VFLIEFHRVPRNAAKRREREREREGERERERESEEEGDRREETARWRFARDRRYGFETLFPPHLRRNFLTQTEIDRVPLSRDKLPG